MRKRTLAAAAGLGCRGGGHRRRRRRGVVGDDGDANVSGPQADHATSAALEATHGGKANSVERDSENGATWEVEVTRNDGSTVDVRLDETYQVVVIEGDSESG